ncbi:MAG: hypothetical protein ACTSRP_24470 [Candidatus Helarchaeota archaeon]
MIIYESDYKFPDIKISDDIFKELLIRKLYRLKQECFYSTQIMMRIQKKLSLIETWTKTHNNTHLPLIIEFFNGPIKEIIKRGSEIYNTIIKLEEKLKAENKSQNNKNNDTKLNYWNLINSLTVDVNEFNSFIYNIEHELDFRIPNIDDIHTKVRLAYDSFIFELFNKFKTPNQKDFIGYPVIFPPSDLHFQINGPYIIFVPVIELYRIRYISLIVHEYFHGYIHRLKADYEENKSSFPQIFKNFLDQREHFKKKAEDNNLYYIRNFFTEIEADLFSNFLLSFSFTFSFFERYYLVPYIHKSVYNKRQNNFYFNESTLRVLLMIESLDKMGFKSLLEKNGYLTLFNSLKNLAFIDDYNQQININSIMDWFNEFYDYNYEFFSRITKKSNLEIFDFKNYTQLIDSEIYSKFKQKKILNPNNYSPINLSKMLWTLLSTEKSPVDRNRYTETFIINSVNWYKNQIINF